MTCPSCRAGIPAGEHFCPSCGRPTSHATPEERARWEVLEWRRVKERADQRASASASSPPAAQARQPAVRPAQPRSLRERLLGHHARREPASAEVTSASEPARAEPTPQAPAETPREEARALEPSPEQPEPIAEPPAEPIAEPPAEPIAEPPAPVAAAPAPAIPRIVVDEASDRAASFIRATLREGSVYVDAGARSGRYALLAAAHVGPGGRVIALEADVTKADRLQLLRDRGASQLEVVHVRLGAEDLPGMITIEPGEEDQPIDRTPARRLDELLRELNADRVDFLRIDVAGAAAKVLAGARGLLESGTFFGPVMVQIDTHALGSRATTPDDVLDHFPPETWADTTGLRLGSFTPSAPKHVRVFERRE